MKQISYTQRFFAVLELLKGQTNEVCRMSSAEIASKLMQQGIKMDPRSITRAIGEMVQAGYPIENMDGYYYRPLFSRGEIEYLLHAVEFGSGLTQEQRARLTEKLCEIGGAEERPLSEYRKGMNLDFENTLAILRDAIAAERQIVFHYGSYDVDKQLHPRLNRVHRIKEYIANPYELVQTNGWFYLIASVNRHVELSHYRIDRIMDIRIRKTRRTPCAEEIDPAVYVTQHPYMYSGEVQEYRIRTQRSALNDVFDWFGTDIAFENTTDEETIAVVRSDSKSMKFWLRRYGAHARQV